MTMNPNRSVAYYDNEDALRKALLAVELSEDDDTPSRRSGIQADDADDKTSPALSPSNEESTTPDEALDWVLPCYDPLTTEAQSMKEELQRLMVLKNYLILDAEKEKAFERITAIAARVFDVPMALISLVDLGRQWFMSNRGLGDVRETPRRYAFCSHAILAKNNMLIVPDATKDFRFKNNPLVTGPPNVRFYAGAALICPEGYKLGTLCVIGTSPSHC